MSMYKIATACMAALILALLPGYGYSEELVAIDLKELEKNHTDDLDGLVKRRHIRVLTVYSKTFYHMDKGNLSGLTYEITRQFEDYLNKKLAADNKLAQKHLKVYVTLIPVKRDELLPFLKEGRGDIAIANLTVTPNRLSDVDFSSPFYTDAKELIIGAPGTPVLSSPEELSGKHVFVRKSSSYYESLTHLNQQLKAARKAPVTIKIAPEIMESEDIMEMINAGLVKYSVIDEHIAQLWKQIYPKVVISEQATLRQGAHTAWAIRKNSPKLKQLVNDFVGHHKKGTKDGNILISRYFKNANYLNDATSKQERKKFHSMVALFKKYGKKYSVDWLLMAAQGYQESRLDQTARSASGAVGVMQVLPSTAKQLDVGDITQLEPNIHAGIKYMRWMMDHYYKDEAMSELDKILFTFASYNAGPRKIAELRREAARRHLNPNVWFQNVEYVAAEKIGYETVTYVSSIFKYYIAYSLILETQEENEATISPTGS